MGSRARPAGRRPTRTVHCPCPRIGCWCSWSTSRPTRSRVVQGRLFGMDQSQANQWIHVLLGVLQGDTAHAGGSPASRSWQERAQRIGVTDARSRSPGRADGRAEDPSRIARGGPCPGAHFPPVGHDGTARRLARPQDPLAQTRGYRGQKTCHMVKHVLLSNAAS